MKIIYTIILGVMLLIPSGSIAQSVKELITSGNSVYIEIEDERSNTKGADESFRKHLMGKEWGRWTLVNTPDSANFICRLTIEKKGYNPMSFKSMGARVRTVVEILTPSGKKVWKSKQQQGNVSEFTGFDALSDAMRKVIRRSLTQELYGENGEAEDDEKEESGK